MRSTTAIPSVGSSVRSWRGESSSSQAITFASSVGRERLELLELAGAEVAVGVRLLAVLDELADDGDAGGAQQLAELGEVAPGRASRRCRARAGARAPRAARPSRRGAGGVRAAARRWAAASPAGGARRSPRELAEPLDGLEQAVVGRRQRDPEEALAVGPVRAAGRDHDRRLLEHVLAVRGGAVEARRDRRPDVDRAARRRRRRRRSRASASQTRSRRRW